MNAIAMTAAEMETIIEQTCRTIDYTYDLTYVQAVEATSEGVIRAEVIATSEGQRYELVVEVENVACDDEPAEWDVLSFRAI